MGRAPSQVSGRGLRGWCDGLVVRVSSWSPRCRSAVSFGGDFGGGGAGGGLVDDGPAGVGWIRRDAGCPEGKSRVVRPRGDPRIGPCRTRGPASRNGRGAVSRRARWRRRRPHRRSAAGPHARQGRVAKVRTRLPDLLPAVRPHSRICTMRRRPHLRRVRRTGARSPAPRGSRRSGPRRRPWCSSSTGQADAALGLGGDPHLPGRAQGSYVKVEAVFAFPLRCGGDDDDQPRRVQSGR